MSIEPATIAEIPHDSGERRAPEIDLGISSRQASSPPTLLERILGEQQSLTAVEEFAFKKSTGTLTRDTRSYARLLPASPPGPGQQYAFEVDLDRCSGCQSCVTACHTMNGLDAGETWRIVGLLVGGTTQSPYLQHVTTACHHCLEPGCLSACPVNAYEKDPLTGIVRHLDDQCFGCQYCTLACPYDVPKYHAGKGIVRKCDMCSQRLAEGEPPACVEACPHEAIRIAVVDVAQVREESEANPFLPTSPEPHLTYPTTGYKSVNVFPRNALAADYYSVSPQHPHWPLIAMLILTQLSVGVFAIQFLLTRFSGAAATALLPVTAAGFGLLALTASLFHLGRPHLAYRAVLGLKHSWLSREIVAFGVFAACSCTQAVVACVDDKLPFADALRIASEWGTVVSGLVGVFCSVMIYVFTKREFWSLPRSAIRFFGTTAILGTAATWTLGTFSGTLTGTAWSLCGTLLIGFNLAKLAFEAAIFRHLFDPRTTSLKRSALLLSGVLSNSTLIRWSCGLAGGVVLPLLILDAPQSSTSLPAMLFANLLLLAGELTERYQYFAAVAAPRMPGKARV